MRVSCNYKRWTYELISHTVCSMYETIQRIMSSLYVALFTLARHASHFFIIMSGYLDLNSHSSDYLRRLVTIWSIICWIMSSWIPKCARAFIDLRHTWTHLLPKTSTDSTEAVRAFFACIAALMSKQLRSIVDQSLKDLLELLQEHNVSDLF